MGSLEISSENVPQFRTVPTVDHAKRTLIGDFYGSFRFSQGDGTTQVFLFSALGDIYRDLWTPQGMQAVLPDALEAAQEQAISINPPVRHLNLPDDKIRPEAKTQWDDFSSILKKSSTIKKTSSLPYHVLRYMMPLTDGRQALKGRYDRPTKEETYESYYRTYILEGRSTRLESFDIIFASLRARQLHHRPNVSLNFLKSAWELHHDKDEPFYPENFQQDLKNSSPFVRLGYVTLTRNVLMKTAIRTIPSLRRPRRLNTRALPQDIQEPPTS